MKNYLIQEINDFVLKNNNSYFDFISSNPFEEPLIRFAPINDPLFEEYKTIIGDFHLSPTEAFEFIYGENSIKDGSVISIALPLSKQMKELNKNDDIPSEEWILLLKSLKPFFADFTEHVSNTLKKEGYGCVNPNSEEFFKITKNHGLSSNWSQKHIAYACGLGTFGLNSTFITEKGRSALFISFVTDLLIKADIRPYDNFTANCLFFHEDGCEECIKRCPVDAISEDGIDKVKCYEFTILQKNKTEGYGCGLCLVDVPCENENPIKSIKNKA
ncbi:hypothetical protein [Methanobrevibacter sp. DSM 116169]|uniref:hypothetical protein n=1 Tax=Methanobrevibacter sp. DSM 116169 TaxID=3242727 RepID=UPI0038FCBED2